MCGCSKNVTTSSAKGTTCTKCNGYKTSKKGTVTCPICKNVFYAK